MMCSVVSNSLGPFGLQPTRLLCPWDFSGKNTRVGCHALLQGIIPIWGWNLQLLVSCTARQILYHWAIQEVHCLVITIWNLASYCISIGFPCLLPVPSSANRATCSLWRRTLHTGGVGLTLHFSCLRHCTCFRNRPMTQSRPSEGHISVSSLKSFSFSWGSFWGNWRQCLNLWFNTILKSVRIYLCQHLFLKS